MLAMIADFANGDARTALNTLEMVVLNGDILPDGNAPLCPRQTLEQCISKKSLLYDKNGEEHYNLISALHKSMRNSDPDAAVYWLARMLEAGEDPLYVARRLVRFASEDVGLADSRALEIWRWRPIRRATLLGMPECYGTSDACGGVPFRSHPNPMRCTKPTRPQKRTLWKCWTSRCRCSHPQRAHTADERAALR